MFEQDGVTPLLIASQGGHVLSAQLLLENKADVNLANKVRGDFRWLRMMMVMVMKTAMVSQYNGKSALTML